MEHFKDKVAFVTGAASGIGKALTEELLKNGARVIATDVNVDLLKEVFNSLGSKGNSVKSCYLDVTDEKAFETLLNDTVLNEGRLDYIFNNAGIAIAGEVRDLTIEHWRKTLDVNLNGVVYGSVLAYKIMVEQGFGHIVNISSVEGFLPFPYTVPYVTSKFAVMGLSQGLIVEGTDLGVKTSVVCPGFIRTPIFDTSEMVNADRQNWKSLAMVPWERFAVTPEKCASIMLKGVAKNKPIITVTIMARVMWWLSRISPSYVLKTVRKDFQKWRYKTRVA